LQLKVLEEFVRCGAVGVAFQRFNISPSVHGRWMAVDDRYRELFKEARELLSDQMEAEAYRRAMKGIPVPVVSRGEIVGETTQYSDSLLMFLMRAARPEKYRDNVHIVTESAVDDEITRLRLENERRRQLLEAQGLLQTEEMAQLPITTTSIVEDNDMEDDDITDAEEIDD
jgi:hypothetical protein